MPLSASIRLIQDLPVRYLDTKPFKIKIEAEKILGPLPPELVKEITNLLECTKVAENIQEKWSRIKEPESSEETRDEQKGVDKDLKRIQTGHSLYAFRFSKRFKHPSIRGKLIYAVTFWDPFELIDRAGQMHGFFLDPPLQIVVPKSKDEWLKDAIEEQTRRGRPVTKHDIAFLKKNYKRFVDPHKKWLVVVFIPTWSIDGVLAIQTRTSGIQSMTSTLVRVESKIAEVVAQHEPLMAIAESQKAVEDAHLRQHHVANDRIKNLTQEVTETTRREKEARTPITIPASFKVFPEMPTVSSTEPAKPTVRSTLEAIDWGNIANLSLAIIGFFLLVGVVANPALIGVGALGAILFISAIVIYFWRRRSAPIEKVKEKAVEAKEEVVEKVRGPS